MNADDLCFTPATKLASLFARGTVSPLEAMQAVLARIERVNPKLNAYCTVAGELAL
jgi:aspartyl-tRNA(Asn)/glutamyl-tRNA(Gln) amidotransferase subunit A